MEWADRMNKALDYIERNLAAGKIDYVKAAREAGCSAYQFQRMFSFIADIPLSEYIRRRRMTLAAQELCGSNVKVIDISLNYGYESPEAFTRAFQQIHGFPPSQVRKENAVLKAYPRISFRMAITGGAEINYRIEKKDAFQIYGIERLFPVEWEKHYKAIPEFWDEILQTGEYHRLQNSTGLDEKELEGLVVHAVSGNRFGEDASIFSYTICAFKTPKSRIEGYTVIDVPASTWGIFTTDPHPHNTSEASQAIMKLNAQICTEWLPSSDYDIIDRFSCEVHYFDEAGLQYDEIWVQIQKK